MLVALLGALTETQEQRVHTHCIDAEETVCDQVRPEPDSLAVRDTATLEENDKNTQKCKNTREFPHQQRHPVVIQDWNFILNDGDLVREEKKGNNTCGK